MPKPRKAKTAVTVRLTEGPLAALDQLVGTGPGQFPTRADALGVLAMRGFDDMVGHRRRVLADPDDRPYRLTVANTFTGYPDSRGESRLGVRAFA